MFSISLLYSIRSHNFENKLLSLSLSLSPTHSDHTLVKANFNIKWHTIQFNKQTASPDYSQLRNLAIKLAYR